jgi:hypothetical protein
MERVHDFPVAQSQGNVRHAFTFLYTTAGIGRLFSYLFYLSSFRTFQSKNSFGLAFDTPGVVKQRRRRILVVKCNEFTITTSNHLHGISHTDISMFWETISTHPQCYAHTFSCSSDLLESASSLNETPCVKKAELALIHYATVSGEECPRRDCEVDRGNDKLAHRTKRRRLDTSDNCNRYHEGDDGHHGTDDEIAEGDDSDRGVDDETVEVDGNDHGVDDEHGDDAIIEQEAQTVLKKITKGLNEMFLVKKSRQLQLQASTDVATNKDLVVSLDFTHSAQGKTFVEKCELLESFFVEQSKSALRTGRELSWKSLFLAACLRKIRDPTLCDTSTSDTSTSIIQWVLAMRIINSIVDGLWPLIGPKAALVYEALASKPNAPHLMQPLIHPREEL